MSTVQAPKNNSADAANRGTRGKKVKRRVARGHVYINASFNNTFITIADTQGNAIAWASAGSSSFKGSRKGTPFAAQVAAEKVAISAKEAGMENVEVFVNGPGPGRESAIRGLSAAGFKVTSIIDI